MKCCGTGGAGAAERVCGPSIILSIAPVHLGLPAAAGADNFKLRVLHRSAALVQGCLQDDGGANTPQ